MPPSLTDAETHFAFGRNWEAFAEKIDARQVEEACRALWRLVPKERLKGQRFLDLGCGSGLSSVAALTSGCSEVLALDIDPASVATAKRLIPAHAPEGSWACREVSVFDLSPETDGRFDVVYSWGVLHHSGDLWRAIENAAAMVRPGGLLVLALYRKTPLCSFWALEKRLYAHGPGWLQTGIRCAYKAVFSGALLASGRWPPAYVRAYHQQRGMSWHHDVHDWLGGYPYESTTPEALNSFLEPMGFTLETEFSKAAAVMGLFGSHCDEFVLRKIDWSTAPEAST